MKYVRKTTGYAWTDHKTNTDIAKELHVNPGLDQVQEYRSNWLQHIKSMPCSLPRLPKAADQLAEGTRLTI
jgi:hypothetical protein